MFCLLVDAVDALGAVSAWVRHTLVDVHLAVGTGRASPAPALVPVNQVLARTAVLAWCGRALVQLVLAQQPRVARMAGARERVLAVDALAMLARIRQAVIDIVLAVESREPGRALALVTGDRVVADAAVPTWAAHAVIDVDLAPRSGEPGRARALVSVNHVRAHAAVLARVRFALVHVNLALRTGKPCKAHAPQTTHRYCRAITSIVSGSREAHMRCRIHMSRGQRRHKITASIIVLAYRCRSHSSYIIIDVNNK